MSSHFPGILKFACNEKLPMWQKGIESFRTIVLWDFLPNWAKVVNTRIIEFTSMMNFQKSKCLFKNGFPEEESAVFM